MSGGGYRSPTVRHKRLTAELRRLRAESGLTRDDVASRLEWHPTKVTRIETGQWTRLNPRDVRDLLDIYGVDDPGQREALVQLARESRQ
jgi:transcriptional regulator with XRE-family HTH domain